MIDATGKVGAGILVGNLGWFGSFDQCQQIKSAHYCTVAAAITIPQSNTVLFSSKVLCINPSLLTSIISTFSIF